MSGSITAFGRNYDNSTLSSINSMSTINYNSSTSIEASAQVGNSIATSTFFIFGNDNFLFGGAGADIISGDVGTLAMTLTGGSTIESSNASATARSEGSGIDTMVTTTNATASVAGVAQIINTDFEFGSEQVMEGGGGDDLVRGDFITMNLNLTGGTNIEAGNATTSVLQINGEVASASAEATSLGYARISNVNFNFGSDGLWGDNNVVNSGAEGNDALEGDGVSLSLVLTGGTSIANGNQDADARAVLDSVNFNFGNDSLVGQGGNDSLMGDLHSFSNTLTDGTGTGLFAAEINNSSLSFGNDTLQGGAGDDQLSGDLDSFNVADLRFWNGVNGNSLNWGNDTLSGGTGSDDFIFALGEATGSTTIMAMQGIDTITDFSLIDGDNLVVGNVKDLNASPGVDAGDLDLSTVFVDIGAINTLAIIFHDGNGAAVSGDVSITGATSNAAAIAAITANGNAEGAILLEGWSTTAISDFATDLIGNLQVSAASGFITNV